MAVRHPCLLTLCGTVLIVHLRPPGLCPATRPLPTPLSCMHVNLEQEQALHHEAPLTLERQAGRHL